MFSTRLTFLFYFLIYFYLFPTSLSLNVFTGPWRRTRIITLIHNLPENIESIIFDNSIPEDIRKIILRNHIELIKTQNELLGLKEILNRRQDAPRTIPNLIDSTILPVNSISLMSDEVFYNKLNDAKNFQSDKIVDNMRLIKDSYPDIADNTLLIHACSIGHVNVVKYLLKTTFNTSESVNTIDQTGKTALMKLVESSPPKRWKEILQCLLEAGAIVDLQAGDGMGPTALIQAVRSQHYAVIPFLLNAGANANIYVNGETALMIAAKFGNKNVIDVLLMAKNISLDLTNKPGYTALMIAVYHGQKDAVRMLVDAGASLEIQDKYNCETALMMAVSKGTDYMLIVRDLLTAGASTDEQVDIHGQTALFHATKLRKGASYMIHTLLIAEAQVDIQDNNGYTCLALLSQIGDINSIHLLLKAGANVNIANHNGDTPLLLAISKGHKKIVQKLIDVGAIIDIQNNYGYSALLKAVYCCDIDIIKLLIEVGANVNLRNYNGYTALIRAAELGNFEVVKLLLEAGAETNHLTPEALI